MQQAGISGGTGTSGAQTAMSAAASVVAALSGSNGADHSTTHAAASDGTLTVRDQAHQSQDVNTLSRDVEHAANALTPMFDKEKEQKRLAMIQLAQTVVNQTINVGVTYGEQQAHDAASKDAAAHAEASAAHAEASAAADQAVANSSWDSFGYYSKYQQHKAAYDQALKNTTAYQNTLKGYGIGSQTHAVIESGANLVTGLIAGNGKGAVASAAAPFLAQGVKHLTTGDQSGEQLSAGEIAGNALGHAVAGGVVADVSGGNAKAGAAGAAAHLIANGKPTEDLTQSEREQISQWGQVAGGVAGGLAGGGKNHAAEIGTGAQAGKNAVEHNRLYTASESNFISTQPGESNRDAAAKVGCALVHCEEEFPRDSEQYKAFKRNSDYVDLALQLYDLGKIGGDISAPFKGTPLEGATVWPSAAEVSVYGQQADILRGTGEFAYSNLNYIADTATRFRVGQRVGGAVQAGIGGVEAFAGASVSSTGVGALAGGPIMFMGSDQVSAGLRTFWTGEQQSTLGGQLISGTTGMSPDHAELVYGVLGDTAPILVASKALRASQPAYRVFTSEEEARQAVPHIFAQQQDRVAITAVSPVEHTEGVRVPYVNAEQAKVGEMLKTPSLPVFNIKGLGSFNSNDLVKTGSVIAPAAKSGKFTVAGRALQKHGSRKGSSFPMAKGRPDQMNKQGEEILNDLIKTPGASIKEGNRFKGFDVIAPNGQGARFDSQGNFRGFLEP